jgi:hypothetical protein
MWVKRNKKQNTAFILPHDGKKESYLVPFAPTSKRERKNEKRPGLKESKNVRGTKKATN